LLPQYERKKVNDDVVFAIEATSFHVRNGLSFGIGYLYMF
jgi:hypothetical protein